jgi:sugar O-acyltransferase (sialic acid O-acetyltransferase NeuD family)
VGKPEIILIGGGGHCRSCIDVIEQQGRFDIAGVVDRPEVAEANDLFGYPLLGNDADLSRLRKSYPNALVTVGQIQSPKTRIRLFHLLKELDFCLPVVISPLAYVSPRAVVDQGTIIMHHVIINAGASIGCNCIINTKALIEHDARVQSHCHISTGAIVNGGSTIGEGSFMGSNSAMVQGRNVHNSFFCQAMSLVPGQRGKRVSEDGE